MTNVDRDTDKVKEHSGVSDVDILEAIARKSHAIAAMLAVGHGHTIEAARLAVEISDLASEYAARCSK